MRTFLMKYNKILAKFSLLVCEVVKSSLLPVKITANFGRQFFNGEGI